MGWRQHEGEFPFAGFVAGALSSQIGKRWIGRYRDQQQSDQARQAHKVRWLIWGLPARALLGAAVQAVVLTLLHDEHQLSDG